MRLLCLCAFGGAFNGLSSILPARQNELENGGLSTKDDCQQSTARFLELPTLSYLVTGKKAEIHIS